MTNFESLVCIQTEIEVIMVCHFHSELEFEQCAIITEKLYDFQKAALGHS